MPNRAMHNHTSPSNGNGDLQAPRTPLEMVREHQAMMHQHRDTMRHPDISPEVPGNSIPSDRRHHPQRQMYNGGRH